MPNFQFVKTCKAYHNQKCINSIGGKQALNFQFVKTFMADHKQKCINSIQ